MTNRRGFTLIELLVGMVLLSLVGVTMIKVIATSQRVTTAQSERVANQSNVRLGTFIVPTELTQVNTTTSTDILSMGASQITYRAMRGYGFLCMAPTATTVSLYRDATYTGRQPILNRDSLLVFRENDPTLSTDDQWVATGLVTNVQANGSCTGGINTLVFTTTGAPTGSNITVGSPVRVFEVMQLGSYVAADGKTYLGIRSVSAAEATLQPVLGPLKAGGFNLAYEDASGTTTASTSAVRSIVMTIVGLTDQSVATSGNARDRVVVQDSLQTRIALRN